MEKKYIAIVCAMLLSACGNYVTREELQRSQSELRAQLNQEDLAVHTCAQTLGMAEMFLMACQGFGSAPHCAAFQSWIESCRGENSDGTIRLPDPGVWERLEAEANAAAEAAGMEVEQSSQPAEEHDQEQTTETTESQDTFVPLDSQYFSGHLRPYTFETESDPD